MMLVCIPCVVQADLSKLDTLLVKSYYCMLWQVYAPLEMTQLKVLQMGMPLYHLCKSLDCFTFSTLNTM